MTTTNPYTMQAIRMPDGDINRMKTAKQAVADYMTENADHFDGGPVDPSEVYVVWFCKTLQNWKALLSSDVVDTGIYFEVTFNGDKGELYLDFYTKQENRPITVV